MHKIKHLRKCVRENNHYGADRWPAVGIMACGTPEFFYPGHLAFSAASAQNEDDFCPSRRRIAAGEINLHYDNFFRKNGNEV